MDKSELRYGNNAFEKGTPYSSKQCMMKVYSGDFPGDDHQCLKRPGHGDGKSYCKQHAKIIAVTDQSEGGATTSDEEWLNNHPLSN